ncbi:RNA polymerase sigma factor [Chitinophaga niabensis]|uniref:RNA polymerase sigma-70 factor, ECF subfamily n=1 Tax=Chitinophaga niabensis TaxID=536979 RepID=A0A1N6E361_9BACT|nr:sigma-70 family RNA polymerase sigma factor [Chitinophaga niabensis]SIN77431.1 RNA polymerase sigma-70 factor, ECF subfamily [Chitinophaga niabensis]
MKRDYKILSENELSELLRENNKLAFTEIYDRYSPLIYSYAKRSLQDKDLAKDILQEVFTIVWETRSKLKYHSSFLKYLFGVTRYRMIRVIRQSKRHQGFLDTLEKIIEETAACPEKCLIDRQTNDIIEYHINLLPERTKAIINLSRTGKYSQIEIAQQFNISTDAVKSEVYRASKRLKLTLQKLRFFLF